MSEGMKSWVMVAHGKKRFEISNLSYVPRIGETISYGGSSFKVKDIVYDFEEMVIWVFCVMK